MLQSCTRLYALQCPIASSTWPKHRTKVGTNSDHRLFLISIFSALSFSICSIFCIFSLFSILPTHLSYCVLANLSIPCTYPSYPTCPSYPIYPTCPSYPIPPVASITSYPIYSVLSVKNLNLTTGIRQLGWGYQGRLGQETTPIKKNWARQSGYHSDLGAWQRESSAAKAIGKCKKWDSSKGEPNESVALMEIIWK